MNADKVVRSAERRSPGLVMLALPLSPAVRIEPELLRAVRFDLFPRLPAGIEGELWFSPLVSIRGQDGIVLDAGVANLLRSRARETLLAPTSAQDDLPTPEAIREAWRRIKKLHAASPPVLQLEEKVNWLAMSVANPETAIEEQLQLAVEALRRGRTGVARWAARALPRMPESARSTTAAWLLAQGAGRRLAARDWETRTPDLARIEDLASLPSLLKDDSLGVYRFGDRLDIGEVGRVGASVRVLDTDPRVLAASASTWKDEQIIQVRRGARVSVTVGSGPVLLRTPRGEIYRVEAEPDDVLPGLRRSCVMVRTEQGDEPVVSMGIAVAPDQVLAVLSPRDVDKVIILAAGASASVAGQVIAAEGRVALLQVEHLPEGVRPIRLPLTRPAPPGVGHRWYGLTYRSGWSWPTVAGVVTGVRDGVLAVTAELPAERPVAGCPVIVDGVLTGLITSQTSEGSFSVETVGVAKLLDLGPAPDRVSALTSAAQAIALEFHMRFEGFRRASGTQLDTDALMAAAGLTREQLEDVRGVAEYVVKDGVEARTRPQWLQPSGPPRFSAAVMTALEEAAEALGSLGRRYQSLTLSGRWSSMTASAQRALTDIGVTLSPSAFGLNAELDSGKFAASGWRQLRTILGDDLPRLDDWDPWSAAPAAAADRPQALLEVLGALCRSDTRVPEPARTVLMYADAHLYPRWWQVRDDLVQAGTPDIGPDQEFPDFLEAYLGWCLTVLQQVGTSAGGYRYDMGFAIPPGDAGALPTARFGLDVHVAQPDTGVRLAGRFSALVGISAWVFLELADQVWLAAGQPPQYKVPPSRTPA